MKSSEITFTGYGDVTLAGTLTLPDGAGPFPGVVCVHGSGNVDRDENPDRKALERRLARLQAEGKPVPPEAQEPPQWNIFRDVAWALAGAGIACLRYDKRGTGESGGDSNVRPLTALIHDVHSAIRTLRAHPAVDASRIGVFGHSEGGYIGPVVCGQDPSIKALCFMGGPATNLKDILLHQARFIAGLPEEKRQELGLDPERDFLAERLAFVAAAEAGEEWFDDPGVPEERVSLIWWREHFASDPVKNIQGVRCPVMVLQGGKDYQVPAREAELLRQALEAANHPDYEVHVFPDLNHLMFPVQGESDGSEYNDPRAHLSAEVIGHIIRWYLTRL